MSRRGPSTTAWCAKRRCWASSSPATPSRATAWRWSFSGPARPQPSASGATSASGIALRWSPGAPPPPDAARAAAALCAAHPGPAPVLVEWEEGDGNGGGSVPGLAPGVSANAGREPGVARFRSRSLRVDAADDLVVALRALLGPEHVHLVRTT